MTKSTKQSEPATSDKTGNVVSAENIDQAHTWTDEEMATSKPLPVPTVEPTQKIVGVTGISHIGKGKTKAGELPENNEIKR
jgi:hypothetical protein